MHVVICRTLGKRTQGSCSQSFGLEERGIPFVTDPAMDATATREHPQDVLEPKVLPERCINDLRSAHAVNSAIASWADVLINCRGIAAW